MKITDIMETFVVNLAQLIKVNFIIIKKKTTEYKLKKKIIKCLIVIAYVSYVRVIVFLENMKLEIILMLALTECNSSF